MTDRIERGAGRSPAAALALAWASALATGGAAAQPAPAVPFTMDTQVTLVDSTVRHGTGRQGVRVRRAGQVHEIAVTAVMPCAAPVATPWLSPGRDPTLVLRQARTGPPLADKESCTYELTIGVAPGRLHAGHTLYAVVGQTVVGHAVVP